MERAVATGGFVSPQITKPRLESATHLVEIDLLRSGTHAVAVPSELVAEQCAKWDYLVCEFTNCLCLVLINAVSN